MKFKKFAARIYYFLLGNTLKSALGRQNVILKPGTARWLTRWVFRFRIVPLRWMDTRSNVRSGRLAGERKLIAYAPHFINQESPIGQGIVQPERSWRLFEDVQVSPQSSSLIDGDGVAVIERFRDCEDTLFNYATGHIKHHDDRNAVIKLGHDEKIEAGIFVAGNGSFNYYHWMIEILPRLRDVENLPQEFASFPLLVPDSYARHASFRDALAILTEPNDRGIRLMARDRRYRVGKLLYIDAVNNLPFNTVDEAPFRADWTALDPQSVAYLRERMMAALPEEPQVKQRPSRLFLGRKHDRREYNEDEIFELLEPQGFERVYFEDHSLAEQARLTHAADYLIGPTGAAWTNLLFCRPGVKALCWMAQEFSGFSAYSTLAKLCGAELHYLGYRAGTHSSDRVYESAYRLSLDDFRSGLQALGLDT